MAGTKLHPVAYQKALKTKPPKHMRGNDEGSGYAGKRRWVMLKALDKELRKRGITLGAGIAAALASDDVKELDKAMLEIKTAEFFIPKPRATEVTGDGGGPVELKISWAKPQDK